MSNHKLTQIFYDGLGPQDIYFLDSASGGTFMSKFEDEAIKLMETVAENNHHNVAKPFERGATPKGGLIDAKSVETGILLEKIDKMAEAHTFYWIDSTSKTDLKDLHLWLYKKCRHAPIALDSTISRWIVLSWKFKGKACIDKAHQEGQVNKED